MLLVPVPGVSEDLRIMQVCIRTGGAKVVVSDINLKGAERVVKEIAGAGGTVGAFVQDTAKPADAEKVVAHAVSTYGVALRGE